MIKDLLFSAISYIGAVIIVLALLFVVLEISNKIFHIIKYVIMYKAYIKEKELYLNKSNLIVTKSGRILYSCATNSLEQEVEIFTKAIKKCNDKIKLRDDFSK